jgi:hypothetical protein
MRALSPGLWLLLLGCSQQIELFPHPACLDAGVPDQACCMGFIDADGTIRPCGCVAVCRTDADCATGRCDAVVGLCTSPASACMTAADCGKMGDPARGWVCKAVISN